MFDNDKHFRKNSQLLASLTVWRKKRQIMSLICFRENIYFYNCRENMCKTRANARDSLNIFLFLHKYELFSQKFSWKQIEKGDFCENVNVLTIFTKISAQIKFFARTKFRENWKKHFCLNSSDPNNPFTSDDPSPLSPPFNSYVELGIGLLSSNPSYNNWTDYKAIKRPQTLHLVL